MRVNSNDKTLKKNYVQKYQHLIKDYELIKLKQHPTYTKVKDFYAAHGTCPQTFLKYYGRYRQTGGDVAALLPKKRGPRYGHRRPEKEVEDLVLSWRVKGCNKYEVHSILQPKLGERTPSLSGIYNIFKRHGQNRLTTPMKEEKRRIIKEKAGELAHIDCHYLSRDMIENDSTRYYLVGVIDSCTRLAWVEVVTNIKSMTVMFATLRCFNYLAEDYQVKFKEVLTDNGPEFGPKTSANKENHPFECLLVEMGMKHRHIRPYRPQTNGKIERFWRTLNYDLIDGTHFDSIAHFKDELLKYVLYYNQLRPHQGMDGKTPKEANENCQRIT